MKQPDTVEQLQADIDKLMTERQGWLEEIERLRAALEEISGMCGRDPLNPFLADTMERVARREMAKRLRGET